MLMVAGVGGKPHHVRFIETKLIILTLKAPPGLSPRTSWNVQVSEHLGSSVAGRKHPATLYPTSYSDCAWMSLEVRDPAFPVNRRGRCALGFYGAGVCVLPVSEFSVRWSLFCV